jgi:hypothetical protein
VYFFFNLSPSTYVGNDSGCHQMWKPRSEVLIDRVGGRFAGRLSILSAVSSRRSIPTHHEQCPIWLPHSPKRPRRSGARLAAGNGP